MSNYNITRFIFLNQVAGPLFRELAEDLSSDLPEESELYTGHQDTLRVGTKEPKLKITASPLYDRCSNFTRFLSWIKYTFCVLWRLLFVPRNTGVFLVSNPPILGPVVWFVCKIRRLPYLVLVYDIHPDTLIKFGPLKEKSLLAKVWRAMNKLTWSNAEAVYTIGPVMAKRLQGQFDVTLTALGRVAVIPPWADTNNIRPLSKKDNPLAEKFQQKGKITVLYSGNMGISHDIDSMLQAAKVLRDEQNLNFLFIGEGAKWQTALNFVKENNLENVQVHPFLPEEKIRFSMALADISLVALDKGAEGLMVPSKMYYYMAAGSAIIGICQGENDLRETIEFAKCGYIVPPGDPQKLADTIRSLIRNPEKLGEMSVNSRVISELNYSRTACIKELKSTLDFIGIIHAE